MPRGDKTGPQGQGSRTGRGLGSCGTETGENLGPGENIGFFRRLGRGLGIGQAGQGRGTGRGLGRKRSGQGQGRNR